MCGGLCVFGGLCVCVKVCVCVCEGLCENQQESIVVAVPQPQTFLKPGLFTVLEELRNRP